MIRHAAEDESAPGHRSSIRESRVLEYGENVFFVPEYERHWYLRAWRAGGGGEAVRRAAFRREVLGRMREALGRLREGGGRRRSAGCPLAKRHLAEVHVHVVEARKKIAPPGKKGFPDVLVEPPLRR